MLAQMRSKCVTIYLLGSCVPGAGRGVDGLATGAAALGLGRPLMSTSRPLGARMPSMSRPGPAVGAAAGPGR